MFGLIITTWRLNFFFNSVQPETNIFLFVQLYIKTVRKCGAAVGRGGGKKPTRQDSGPARSFPRNTPQTSADHPTSLPDETGNGGGQKMTDLTEQTETHVVVGLFGFFLLLLFLLLGGSRGSGRSSTTGSRGTTTGTDAGSDVRDQILDVDSLQGLGEQTGPVRLDFDVGGLQDGRDLLIL